MLIVHLKSSPNFLVALGVTISVISRLNNQMTQTNIGKGEAE